MSETTNLSLEVGIQFTFPLDIDPSFVLLTNKSPYDLQYSGYGTTGVEWAAAGTERKLYGSVYNGGKINLTPFNTSSVSPPSNGIVLITQYLPGEEPKGTWPVSIPFQTVQLAIVTSLSDEGRIGGLLTIDIGDTNFPKLIQIFNDGTALWFVDQNGVKHAIFNIQSAGNPLILGQLNDNTEVAGTLVCDNDIFYVSANVNPATTTLNGNVSGTAVIRQYLYGSGVHITVQCTNLRFSSSLDLAIPHPGFIEGYVRTTNVPTISFKNGGVGVNADIITALGASGGTVTNQSTMGSYSNARVPTFDTITFNSGATAHTGTIIIDGR